MKTGQNCKDRHIPASLIRRLWLDQTLSREECARIVGLTCANFWRRAKALGLPSRGEGGRPIVIRDEAEFRRMWLAGVSAARIAAHFGVCRDTPLKTARRLGLQARGKGRKPLTVDQFREAELARLLAKDAASTRAAWRDAEMVDSPQAFQRLSRKAA